MKIKEGMYVRTLDGISKVIEIKDNGVMGRFVNEYGNVYFFDDMMCNPSFNVIDLIEVGDYVNGHKVCDDFRLDTDDYGNNFIEIGIESDKFLNHYIREDEIETIVTKQQMESMQYEVK